MVSAGDTTLMANPEYHGTKTHGCANGKVNAAGNNDESHRQRDDCGFPELLGKDELTAWINKPWHHNGGDQH